MKAFLVTIAWLLALSSPAAAEDPATIVKRLPNDGAECHYVLSLCSDADRADATLARVQSEPATADDANHAGKIAVAEARVAKQTDLLARAAAAVRARHPEVPPCFRRCARLQDSR